MRLNFLYPRMDMNIFKRNDLSYAYLTLIQPLISCVHFLTFRSYFPADTIKKVWSSVIKSRKISIFHHNFQN